jgi:hypothetical protein
MDGAFCTILLKLMVLYKMLYQELRRLTTRQGSLYWYWCLLKKLLMLGPSNTIISTLFGKPKQLVLVFNHFFFHVLDIFLTNRFREISLTEIISLNYFREIIELCSCTEFKGKESAQTVGRYLGSLHEVISQKIIASVG